MGIVNNRQTLTNWIRAGRFPAGIRLGGAGMRTLLWPVDEVAAVLGQRAAERPEGHGVMTPIHPSKEKPRPLGERPGQSFQGHHPPQEDDQCPRYRDHIHMPRP
jgi:predicted DNA-binding transcriptional regulator AlpA